jgi:hypothetical protein
LIQFSGKRLIYKGVAMFSLKENFPIGRIVAIDVNMPCDSVLTETATVVNLDGETVSFMFSHVKGFYLTKPTTADLRIDLPGETICYRATIIPNTILPFVTARIEDRIRIIEKRSHKRINTFLPVHMVYDSFLDSTTKTVTGKMPVNISAGGIRIKNSEKMPVGTNVMLSIALPEGPEMIPAMAKTVYSRMNEHSRLHISAFEFTWISDDDRKAVDGFVKRIESGRLWQERNSRLFRYESEGGNCLRAVLKATGTI